LNIPQIVFFAPIIRHNLIALAVITALSALWIIWLALRVIRLRWKTATGIGDGGHPDLERAIRVHANAVEIAPLTLLLLLMAALTTARSLEVIVLGILFLLGRVLHGWGLSRSAGPSVGRASGIILNFLVIAILSGQLIALLFR
jgi:uncharacterized membrane protein YecN with MAPEG domain